MTTSGRTSDNQWQRVTTNYNEWQRAVILANFSDFFFLHGGWFFTGVFAAMHSFRGYMEQIIFDRSYFVRTATFLEDLS